TRPAQGGLARHGREIQLGRDARCLATRLTHRSGHHPGSRCPALLAATLPQGPVVLHTGHTARPHPPAVRVRRAGTGRRLTQRNGTGKRPPFRCEPSPEKKQGSSVSAERPAEREGELLNRFQPCGGPAFQRVGHRLYSQSGSTSCSCAASIREPGRCDSSPHLKMTISPVEPLWTASRTRFAASLLYRRSVNRSPFRMTGCPVLLKFLISASIFFRAEAICFSQTSSTLSLDSSRTILSPTSICN